MILIYVDETGDPSGDPKRGASEAYALGVIALDSSQWNVALVGLKNLRRAIRDTFGVSTKAEIKASSLVHTAGDLKGSRLSSKQKRLIYKWHLRKAGQLNLKAFAVWVDKRPLSSAHELSLVREQAWVMLLQRLERTFRDTEVMIFHDQGDDHHIRRYARKARRFQTAGLIGGSESIRVDFKNLIEDPISKISHESLFVQLADLVAYAAARRRIRGGERAYRVCPETMWDELGESRLAAVNRMARIYGLSSDLAIVTKN